MLKENRNYLKNVNQELLREMEKELHQNTIAVEERSKSGSKTIFIQKNDKKYYVHSFYNPEKEAEIVSQNIIAKEGTPLIFLGMGLGYHLRMILQKIKPSHFYIVDFSRNIQQIMFNHISFQEQEYKGLKNIFLCEDQSSMELAVNNILRFGIKPPQIVVLPSYLNIFKQEVEIFEDVYKEHLTYFYDRISAEYNFQNRWGLNSLENLPVILNSRKLFQQIDKNQFKDKPAIIVGAGPSLSNEFENLRKIKKDRSAFIFSVGSAINALIEYGIHPDATVSYDPKEYNIRTFEKMNERHIKDIPLLFGSTINSASLRSYPGETISFFTSQDFLNPFLFDQKNTVTIQDAPSVSVIALEILFQLGCNPIIFVGHDLAFHKNRRYSAGINYKPIFNNKTVGESVLDKELYIRSVNGEELKTKKEFMLTKQSIEQFLADKSDLKVINCTKNGADIKHTRYRSLEEVISKEIKRNIVSPFSAVFLSNSEYSNEQAIIREKLIELAEERKIFVKLHEKIRRTILDIKLLSNQQKKHSLNKLLSRLDKQIHEMKKLHYYAYLVGPMSRLQHERAAREIEYLRSIDNERINGVNIHKTIGELVETWAEIDRQIKSKFGREEISGIFGNRPS